jgi:hypothetical protein
MNKIKVANIGYLFLAGVVLSWLLVPTHHVNSVSPGSPDAVVIPEGNDFATQVLHDPWEMDQFSDVSQYLNQSGQVNYLQNVSVSNGVFSATATSKKDAQFFPLFPGYLQAMLIGKVGARYPMNSATYHCLSVAMQTTPAASGDFMQFFWFADDRLNGAPADSWGFTGGYPTSSNWKLYTIDLSAAKGGNASWSSRSTWQGLRIDPSAQAGTSFAIDWVRLTDCVKDYTSVSWKGANGTVSIYLQPQGTNRQIEVATGVSQSPYQLDVSGVQPGSYTVVVKSGSSTLSSTDIVINPAPILIFDKPSYSSGVDYATQAGKPWDMSSQSSVNSVECAGYSFSNGLLNLTTQPAPLVSENCASGEVADPKVLLAVSSPAKTTSFPYLTVRIRTDDAYQNVPNGMILRWVWSTIGYNGDYRCYMVSQDIPIDIGWQTVSIDLSDPAKGLVKEFAGDCPSSASWMTSHDAMEFRLDPNENILGHPLTQAIDWVKLTAKESISAGTPFPIIFALNKQARSLRSLQFFYTTDRSAPTQHPLILITPNNPTPSPRGKAPLFLPIIINGPSIGTSDTMWNTSSVAPNSYYICAQANDGYNTSMSCSEVPVQVR